MLARDLSAAVLYSIDMATGGLVGPPPTDAAEEEAMLAAA
eukprot:COSAG03_NODE_14190_length_473_cov_0.954545_1_plen_39_part_10